MHSPLKILIAVHGFPPEMHGGTEETVLAQALTLRRAGHEVLLVAGSDRFDLGPETRAGSYAPSAGEEPLRVLRIQRIDNYYGHWQKGVSHAAGDAFDEILRRERPDVVHVHHWIRLTRDLVARAASLGIPAVVTLHDLSSSCLSVHRVHPVTRRPCDEALAPEPCLDCAARLYVPTPWIDRGEEARLLEQFRRTFASELSLAREVVVLSHSQRELLTRFLPDVDTSAWHVQRPAPPRELRPGTPPRALGGRLVLGAWGSIHPLKGLDIVAEALSLCTSAGHDVEVRLAGQLTDAVYLERVQSLAPAGRLRWLGPFPDGGLAEHPVTDVHAFVSGTRARETWGVVLDEALALRLPMIAPRHGALAERFVDGEGMRFYEPCEPADLARVVAELAVDPSALARLRASLPPPPELAAIGAEQLEESCRLYARAVARGAPRPTEDPRLRREADEQWLRTWEAELALTQVAANRPPQAH